MNAMLLNLAVHFIIHEIANVGKTVDWEGMKSRYDAQLKTFLPSFWQGDVVTMVNGLVDAVALACKDEVALEVLYQKSSAKDWDGALQVLKGMLTKVPLGSFVVALLSAA